MLAEFLIKVITSLVNMPSFMTNIFGSFSGPGVDSFIEPLPAVSLNDELQQMKSLVARAEEAVLSKLTDKVGYCFHLWKIVFSFFKVMLPVEFMFSIF